MQLKIKPSDRVVVLGTGGTIAGLALSRGQSAYEAAQVPVEGLLNALPLGADGVVECEQLCQVDSKDVTHGMWLEWAQRVDHHLRRDEVSAIVITHGTDSLEETAFFLQQVLAPSKPVILVAAMRPSNALLTDGPQNLFDALVVAASNELNGVMVVMGGRVWSACEVRKWHPWQLNAFGAPESNALADVHSGQITVYRTHNGSSEPFMPLVNLPTQTDSWPWVEIISTHAGSSPRALNTLIKAGVQGLVITAMGNGSVHQSLLQAVEACLGNGQLQTSQILVATRCSLGGIIGVVSHGLPTAGLLTPAQARVKLMLSLM